MLLGSLIICTYYWSCSKFLSFNLQQTLLSVPSAEYVRKWSAYYTSEAHFSGQGLSQARWTEAKWKEFGITNTRIFSYDTQLPALTGHQRLALLRGNRVIYEAPMMDDVTAKGPAANTSFLPAYFGFSANGNISGSYVFCNFGSEEDFQDLERGSINVVGKIAIIKLATASPYLRFHHLEISRGAQLVNAEKAGMIGVVFYTDPQNDGSISEANGYKAFPAGPARPLAGIERGSVGRAGK